MPAATVSPGKICFGPLFMVIISAWQIGKILDKTSKCFLLPPTVFDNTLSYSEHALEVYQSSKLKVIPGVGDCRYWDAGADLAIFYDDIYEQAIVEVITLGHAESGAETMANESGKVRLELVGEEK